jgi:hypothetical protein
MGSPGGSIQPLPFLLAALASTLLACLPASAIELQANTLSDAVDADPADGICDADLAAANPSPTLGQCTLRAAVQVANALPGPDTILLRDARYTLSLSGAGEDAGLTGDLDVTSDIAIAGEGYPLSLLDGKRLRDRIFDVHPGGVLALTGTSLMFGETDRSDADPGFPPGEVSGGCLRSAGVSNLDEAYFFRCSSRDDGGCMSVIGGAATVTDSVFASCRAKNEGGAVRVAAGANATFSRVTGAVGRAATGAGIATRGALTLRNATFTLGRAKLGGGVAVLGAGSATIASSTIASNRADNLASQTSGLVTVSSSIVWGAKTDCTGPVVSGGGNLEGGAACAFAATNDQQGQDPGLQALAFDGNLVPTLEILAGSPAVDHGLDVGDACLDPGDARGRLRVQSVIGGAAVVDAGAFELDGASSETLAITSSPPDDASVGVAYGYDVEAANPGRESCALTFSLDESPLGMTIVPVSGLIAWTPVPSQVGSFDVEVRVTDSGGIATTQAFTITVAPAP